MSRKIRVFAGLSISAGALLVYAGAGGRAHGPEKRKANRFQRMALNHRLSDCSSRCRITSTIGF
jgi:hypothetical protein